MYHTHINSAIYMDAQSDLGKKTALPNSPHIKIVTQSTILTSGRARKLIMSNDILLRHNIKTDRRERKNVAELRLIINPAEVTDKITDIHLYGKAKKIEKQKKQKNKNKNHVRTFSLPVFLCCLEVEVIRLSRQTSSLGSRNTVL